MRTLGFDRDWVSGVGSHLIDREDDRYLDLSAGYGVFSLGRDRPYVKAQLHRVLTPTTPNLPQLGVSTLPGLLAQELIARAPASLDAVVLTSSGTESGRGGAQARPRRHRPRADPLCRRSFHGLSIGSLSVNGDAEFRERFGPLLPAASRFRSATPTRWQRELAAGDVAALIVEPVQGKGVFVAPDGYLAAAQELSAATARC